MKQKCYNFSELFICLPQEASYTLYATGNRSAFALLDEERRNDPSTYPPPELLAKLELGMPIDAEGQ
jgi:hypothetical protein